MLGILDRNDNLIDTRRDSGFPEPLFSQLQIY
jgi:hypothetical protein